MKIFIAKYNLDSIKIYKRIRLKTLTKFFNNSNYLFQIDKIQKDKIYISEFHPYDFM